jgi:hypothetical protein
VHNEVVCFFFSYYFQETSSERPTLDGIVFPTPSIKQNSCLTRAFLIEEIKEVVMLSDGNKSLG